MKNQITILLALLCSFAHAQVADSTGYIVRVGQEAPDFQVSLDNGKVISLSSLKGKVVMLQFTASWCGVCRREMPEIEKQIWQRHKDNPDFVLMGIDRDEPLEKVQEFAKQTKITYPLGLDPGANIYVKYALKESGITRNCLIDRNGKIVKLTRLYKEDEFANLVSMIDSLLIPQKTKKKVEEKLGGFSEKSNPTQEDCTIFKKATKNNKALSRLTPILVSTQVVAGTNYIFVCKDKKEKKVQVKIFKPLPGRGEPQIISIN